MSETLVDHQTILDEFFGSLNFGWRAKAFRKIADSLLSLNRPVCIVETGTMRPPCLPGHEYEDGQSTLVWDLVARLTEGIVFTIDINKENIQYAQPKVSERVKLIEGDSLLALASLQPPAPIDLLYLDSMDFRPGTELESTLHHAGELAAAWKHLASGAIVAVDDCIAPFYGKHALVRCFWELLAHRHPEALGVISWWRRP